MSFLVKLENEKITRDELGAIFEDARLICADALRTRYGAPCAPENEEAVSYLARLDKARLTGLSDLLATNRRHCTYNVGVGMTTGGFAAELEEKLSL